MNLLDFLTSPWAILPDKLLELQAIYATHLRGEKIDIDAIEKRIGRPLANDQQTYVLRDGGVAVLPITGVLAPKANLFMRVSGGHSMQMMAEQVRSMQADPRVRAVVLAVDSPGGSVLGTPALAEAVRALADEKPTVTVSEGTIASAAYWIGSAANAVYIEGVTDQVGSIGVVATHSYDPQMREQRTDIYAGKYKRIASPDRPLSAEGKAYLQEQVDHLYSVFVDAVAQQRGVDADAVLERMADGRVFIGQQAINAGLVDGVATVEAMVDRLATDPSAFARRRKAVFALARGPQASDEPVPLVVAPPTPPTSDKDHPVMNDDKTPITRESLERDHAALFAQLRSDFRAEGASAEIERQKGVRAVLIPGHEALVEQLASDGKTTPAEAALAVNAAERGAREAALKAHHDDAPKPAAGAPASESNAGELSKEQQVQQAKKYAAEKGVDFVSALKALGFAA